MNPTVEVTRSLIVSGKIDFVNAKEINEQEQEVVDALVKLEPNDRIELAQLLKMRWLAEWSPLFLFLAGALLPNSKILEFYFHIPP